ncbi:hypothetical protein V8G54_008470 [Vigna mungo]|uniref:Uncharacterized protein n=1 Tax=Vigna mungo TaxID=3915 RepID=A0AAQ3P4A7_VIGMU
MGWTRDIAGFDENTIPSFKKQSKRKKAAYKVLQAKSKAIAIYFLLGRCSFLLKHIENHTIQFQMLRFIGVYDQIQLLLLDRAHVILVRLGIEELSQPRSYKMVFHVFLSPIMCLMDMFDCAKSYEGLDC